MKITKISHSESIQYEIPEHCTGEWEVVLQTEGEGIFFYRSGDSAADHAGGGTMRETAVPFRPGDIFVIPPDIVCREVSETGFSYRMIRLSNFRAIGRMGVKCFRDDREGSVAQIFDLADRFRGKETASAGAVVNSLGDVLYHTLAVYYDQNRSKDLRLEGMLELMHSNIADPEFDLAKAIRESGYSTGYFRRIFREMTGEPPAVYLQHLRINQAKSLFQQYGSTRTVKEIALLCGYTDPLYFSRIFRKAEGMSPREYQEKMMRRGED